MAVAAKQSREMVRLMALFMTAPACLKSDDEVMLVWRSETRLYAFILPVHCLYL